MAYYLFFMMVSLAVVTQLVSRIVESSQHLKQNEHLAVLPLIFLVGSYIFLVFGFVSRRCERQADLYGCRTVSCGRAHCLDPRIGRRTAARSAWPLPDGHSDLHQCSRKGRLPERHQP